MAAELKFTAAPPLGRLCGWLRTLGFDCIYPSREAETPSELSPADRIYITRHFDPTARRVIFIGVDNVFDQLKVMEMLVQLKGLSDPLTRCIRCNTRLVTADRTEVDQRVPEYVAFSHDRFTRCPSCGRIYWPGTHAGRMGERISGLFG